MFGEIKESIKDKFGKISHSKISSYLILCSILITSLVFVSIDLINAISLWKKSEVYKIPASHITIFGMILTHHLFLLGIKKDSENKEVKCNSDVKISENSNKKDGN